jgi:choline-sulfatase
LVLFFVDGRIGLPNCTAVSSVDVGKLGGAEFLDRLKYVHEIGHWDNATPYDGEIRSWGHHFDERGIDVTTVGKLDFVPDVDDGFTDQRVPIHRETPDIHGLHRDPPIQRENSRDRIEAAGPAPDGEAWYCEREGTRTREAIEFLEARAGDSSDTEPCGYCV